MIETKIHPLYILIELEPSLEMSIQIQLQEIELLRCTQTLLNLGKVTKPLFNNFSISFVNFS